MKITDYLPTYIKVIKNKNKSWAESERRLLKYLIPLMGNLKMTTIKRKHIVKLHESIDAPIEANMVIRTISAMFGQAELDETIPRGTNPCFRIPMNAEPKRKVFLDKQGIKKLVASLDHEQIKYRVFFLILLYTGARESEIRTASWSDIDVQTLHLSDSKTGAKDIHLPDAVIELLDQLEPKTGSIFDFAYPQKAWARICKRAGLTGIHIHDLRRTFASVALSNGVTLDQVGALLGHKTLQTTKRYAYLGDNEAKASVNLIAGFINE